MKGTSKPKMSPKMVLRMPTNGGKKPIMTKGSMPTITRGSAPKGPVKASHPTGKNSGKHIKQSPGLKGRKFVANADTDADGM